MPSTRVPLVLQSERTIYEGQSVIIEKFHQDKSETALKRRMPKWLIVKLFLPAPIQGLLQNEVRIARTEAYSIHDLG